MWVAFVIGLKESISPLVLATFLTFYLLMSWGGSSFKRTLSVGSLFLGMNLLTKFILMLSLWDPILIRPFSIYMLIIGYSLFALVFLYFGFAYFGEWLKYRPETLNQGTVKLPAFMNNKEDRPSSKSRTFYLMAISLGLAFLTSILSDAAAGDSLVYSNFAYLCSLKRPVLACLSWLIYNLTRIWPVLVIWFLILGVVRKKKVKELLTKTIVKFKIVTSAACFGMAIGLIYFIQNHFHSFLFSPSSALRN